MTSNDFNYFLEVGDRWRKWIINDLGLDPDDEVHEAAVYVLSFQKYLFEMSKKTTVSKRKKELDKLTEQALQLLETIRSLPRDCRNSLPVSLRYQYGVKIVSKKYGVNISNDQLFYYIESLAKAAQSVKKVKLEPIASGYYNGFLFKFIDNLLDLRFELKFYSHGNHTKGDSTETELKSIMLDFWNEHYSKKVRETAIQVIQKELSHSKNKHTAQKAVDTYLNEIVSERIGNKANKLLDNYNKIKSQAFDGNN